MNQEPLTTITATCQLCAQIDKLSVRTKTLDAYLNSKDVIQNVFSQNEFTPEEREIIMAHKTNFYLCPPCWDKSFPDD